MAGYREEPGGEFESDGKLYDLNRIFEAVEHEPVQQIAVKELIWVLQYDSPDRRRVERADLSAPILVTRYQGKELVVDGLHRLAKAVQMNQATLPYRRVSPEAMRHALIPMRTESLPAWMKW